MAVVGKIISVQSVVSSVKYARDGLDRETREEKCVLSGGYGIDPDNAEWQIKAVARAYGKEKGVQGYSMVTSFKAGEVTPSIALQVVRETWEKVTQEMNGDFPCAFYVHGNTNHIHVHAVAGAIDPQTGVKLHQKRMWELLSKKSDEVCKKYMLSVIEKPAYERQDRVEYHLNEKGDYSWKTDLKNRIEKAMNSLATDVWVLSENLSELGVTLHKRVRQGEPIFMYEFQGADNKLHKIKDYKLGGYSYERKHLVKRLKDEKRRVDNEWDLFEPKKKTTALQPFEAKIAHFREQAKADSQRNKPRRAYNEYDGPSL